MIAMMYSNHSYPTYAKSGEQTMAKAFQKKQLSVACALLITSISGQIHASGFAIIEQSGSGMGNAFANSAEAGDASTIFFNPAGMSLLEGTQVTSALHLILPSGEFNNEGSNLNPNLTGGAVVPNSLQGDGKIDGGLTAVVPNLYFVTDVTDSIKFGLGVNAPFGLATEYDDDWVGRYHALKSEVKTINLNPSLSFKVSDMFSFGIGLNAQYEETTLTNKIDFGTVCIGSIEPRAGAGTCSNIGVNPLQADGEVDVEVNSWGFGFNFGGLIHINENMRVGFAYRSSIKHRARGNADFKVPAQFQSFLNGAGIPLFRDTGVRALITLPETASINGYFKLSREFAVMADVTWTRWSRFEELNIRFDSPAQPASVQPENWEDTYRYSVAINYNPMDALVLRMGVAYDETPIPNALDRTPRVPGNDRRWLTFGAGYQLSKQMTFDFGYAHLFVSDVNIDATDISTKHRILGHYESNVNIFSGQITYKF